MNQKIQCPNCTAFKKGIVFAIENVETGNIIGKCQKCGAFIEYDCTNKIIKVLDKYTKSDI